jgi:aspergillopepsin I
MGGASFTIRYGDGTTAAGLVFTDAVTVLGQGANVTATAQAVGAATSVADRFFRQGNDGIVGMGFASQNTVMPVKQKTFFDNIKGGLRMPVFTAWLKHGAGGAYDFGYIDPLKYRVRPPFNDNLSPRHDRS